MRVQPDSLDRDFLTFRRTRDPVALAAVFDAAAPRLLLVAMHLCRDAASAEDLVQTVFLQVLRDVERFEAGKPVLPWLLAMVEHRASDLRRRAHVRRESTGAAPDGVAATDAGPERLAAQHEARERVAQALAGMPRDYRDVLTLRLVHGLSSVAIAHAHGVAPATVRTRLRRGLELLRGALPRGLATPGLLALLGAEMLRASDGLAAVRAKVLAAAGSGVGVAAVAAMAAWWVSLFVAAAVFAGWLLWPCNEAEQWERAKQNAQRSASSLRDTRTTAEPSKVPPAAEPGTAGGREAVGDGRISTIRGRVLDDATKLPLANVQVMLRGDHERKRGDMPVDWRDPEPLRTAADGAFSFAFLPEPVLGISLRFVAGRHVTGWRSFAPLREGVVLDVGEVRLARGTPVRLRVQGDGHALGALDVYAGRGHDGGRPNAMDGYHVDADGIVELGVCTPGDWYYEVRTNRRGAEGRFAVPLQEDVLEHTVVLERPPRAQSISGRLVDTAGAPVASVELGILLDRGRAVAKTEADGTFVWRVRPGAEAARIVLPPRCDLEWIDDGGEVAPGTHGECDVRRRSQGNRRSGRQASVGKHRRCLRGRERTRPDHDALRIQHERARNGGNRQRLHRRGRQEHHQVRPRHQHARQQGPEWLLLGAQEQRLRGEAEHRHRRGGGREADREVEVAVETGHHIQRDARAPIEQRLDARGSRRAMQVQEADHATTDRHGRTDRAANEQPRGSDHALDEARPRR